MGGGQAPTTCACGHCTRCKRRAYIRDWKRRNPERAGKSRRAWAVRNPNKVRAAVRRYKEQNPEKQRAHNAVNNAIRAGKLERQPCEVCGANAHAHHEDYAKPLDVRWLCPAHHGEVHRLDEVA
jgi:hypothetical protein